MIFFILSLHLYIFLISANLSSPEHNEISPLLLHANFVNHYQRFLRHPGMTGSTELTNRIIQNGGNENNNVPEVDLVENGKGKLRKKRGNDLIQFR